MKRVAIIVPTLAALLGGLLYFAGIVGSSRARVERDHSIKLPKSAADFFCEPFVSLSWLWDSGERATFVLIQGDLDEVVRQFKDTTLMPEGLRGVSKDGNIATVSTEAREDGKLLVTIDTTWN